MSSTSSPIGVVLQRGDGARPPFSAKGGDQPEGAGSAKGGAGAAEWEIHGTKVETWRSQPFLHEMG